MTLNKRGLGRGLEVLLADTSIAGGEQTLAPSYVIQSTELSHHLQQEKTSLLFEAEALLELINEIEASIHVKPQVE